MHRLKRLGLTLIAVAALSAVASASASAALPEFVLAKGEVFPDKFEATLKPSSGQVSVSTGQTTFLECTGSKIKGEVTSAKNVSDTYEMTGCRIGPSEPQCHTAGAAEGVVVMTGTGTVAYIKKATKQVGVVLALKTGTIFCDNVEELIKGSIIGPATPINTKATSIEMRYEGFSGQEAFTQYENEKGEKVKAAPEMTINGARQLVDINVEAPLKLTMAKAVTLSA